ncbi:hypothetical protein AYO21_01686 [Fonsecaea monophora]|uniref:Uncharacterized protein n=1 Tax=Fonsecaea monophora TaxID=254056 RepID=A0A177FM46_9EURO|nr:hypothetical protein AYO21_01686 [Fonsecaea monophora]KAH0845052.1 hypothetical protein FOPE_09793 [Fonsecaea pedrosoi]OAG44229.1 hypothetical protein AYO21_01686 [Fonsecaea monophora]
MTTAPPKLSVFPDPTMALSKIPVPNQSIGGPPVNDGQSGNAAMSKPGFVSIVQQPTGPATGQPIAAPGTTRGLSSPTPPQGSLGETVSEPGASDYDPNLPGGASSPPGAPPVGNPYPAPGGGAGPGESAGPGAGLQNPQSRAKIGGPGLGEPGASDYDPTLVGDASIPPGAPPVGNHHHPAPAGRAGPHGNTPAYGSATLGATPGPGGSAGLAGSAGPDGTAPPYGSAPPDGTETEALGADPAIGGTGAMGGATAPNRNAPPDGYVTLPDGTTAPGDAPAPVGTIAPDTQGPQLGTLS